MTARIMYLNLIQIAESFGVAESVVDGWVRNEGMPHTWDRGRLIFDRAQVVEWGVARGLAAQAGFLAPESAVFATGCRLEPLLRAGRIWRDLAPQNVANIFDQIVAALPGVTQPVRQMLTQRLHGKGGVTWAPIGGGVALPHPSARVSLGRDSGILALLLLRVAMEIPSHGTDTALVTQLFFFIAPSPRAHLDLLGRLSRLIARGPLRELVLKDAHDDAIFAALAAADKSSANGASEGKS